MCPPKLDRTRFASRCGFEGVKECQAGGSGGALVTHRAADVELLFFLVVVFFILTASGLRLLLERVEAPETRRLPW